MKKVICFIIALLNLICTTHLYSQEQNDSQYLFNAIKDGNYELFIYYIEKKGLGVNCTCVVDTFPFESWHDSKDTLTPIVYLFFLRPKINGQTDIAWNYKDKLLIDVYEDMLDYLLKNGADVNFKTKKGYTCIEYFYNQGLDLYIHGDLGWVKKLYEAGFDFSNSRNLGWQILRNHELELFYYLIDKDIDFSITISLNDIQNFEVKNINLIQFAIYMYIYAQKLDFIQDLIDTEQININGQDSNGDTALHYAVYLNYPYRVTDSFECLEWVKFLIKNGANPHIKNNDGLTPLDVAVMHGQNSCASYLLQFE